jgi:hypothetical protein
VPVLIPVQHTCTTQSVLWGSGNSTGRKAIFPGCSKTTAVDFAPMAVLTIAGFSGVFLVSLPLEILLVHWAAVTLFVILN